MLVRTRCFILLSFAIAAFGGGCATISVQATLSVPAEVPVQTFPYIAIIRADDPEGEFAQLRIFEYLAAGDSHVELCDEEEIAQRLREGTLATPIVILATRLRIEEGFEGRWGHRSGRPPLHGVTMPVRRSPTGEWSVVDGRLSVVVSDGETGRRFQEYEVRAREEGGDFELMRLVVLERLATDLAASMADRQRDVRVDLLRVDLAGSDAAVAAARRGDWDESRARWAQLVQDARTSDLGPEARAALLYNWAIALRFARPRSPQAVDGAERAIRRALALDSHARYLHALEELGQHRERLGEMSANAR